MAQRRGLTRRAVLRALGAAGAATAAGTLTPRATHAQALGRHEPVETALERLFGDRALQDGRARIRLDIPNIAENGASVPVSVEVDAPMTPQRYVRHIYVVADKNRIPIVTRAMLTPDSGRAYIAANIRLGESGDVRAIVEQSDGTLLQTRRAVRVTVGGCGG